MSRSNWNDLIVQFWFVVQWVAGAEPMEDSRVYYNKESRSILGIAIILPQKFSEKPMHFDFVSSVLNHDAQFTVDCFKKMISGNRFHIPPQIKKVKVWCDCGGHFRCAEFLKYVIWALSRKVKIMNWGTNVDILFKQISLSLTCQNQ